MESITKEQADVIGEIANICTGTAATALSLIINCPTNITTPKVEILSQEENLVSDDRILVKVPYTKGIDGTNLMMLHIEDALIIASLMMGGDGRDISGLGLPAHQFQTSKILRDSGRAVQRNGHCKGYSSADC